MMAHLWFTIIGALLLSVALTASWVSRLPLSPAMLYLLAGVFLGPRFAGMLELDPFRDAELLERITEIAVIVSLFTAGLKLSLPLRDRRWKPVLRLAFLSMGVTVGAVALLAEWVLPIPFAAALLLGVILAPTDPVLASEVQVDNPEDFNQLRFSLTGEACFNDGVVLPIFLLGLGLMGLHDLGNFGWRWLLVDVIWAIPGGLLIGGALGMALAAVILRLRRKHKEAIGLDDFLALGLIGLSYGVAMLTHANGFLAVFAAGVAMRKVASRHSPREAPPPAPAVKDHEEAKEDLATQPEHAPAYMAQALLEFNEQLERIAEITVVILLGALLPYAIFNLKIFGLVLTLLLFIRPLAVYLGLLGSTIKPPERRLMAWFGVRGIGSVFYAFHAITSGVPKEFTTVLLGLTFAVVVSSLVAHGMSVTPIMKRYRERRA